MYIADHRQQVTYTTTTARQSNLHMSGPLPSRNSLLSNLHPQYHIKLLASQAPLWAGLMAETSIITNTRISMVGKTAVEVVSEVATVLKTATDVSLRIGLNIGTAYQDASRGYW
jgi:hypothetical protein